MIHFLEILNIEKMQLTISKSLNCKLPVQLLQIFGFKNLNIGFLKIVIRVEHIYISKIIAFLNINIHYINWQEKYKASCSLLKQIYRLNLVIFTIYIAILFYHLVLKKRLNPIQKLIGLPLKEVHFYIYSLIKYLNQLIFQINWKIFTIIDDVLLIVDDFLFDLLHEF